MSALKNIFKTTHIGDLAWARESDRTSFIARHSSRDMLNFAFLEMGLGKVSLSRFVYVSKKKRFLYSINSENFNCLITYKFDL